MAQRLSYRARDSRYTRMTGGVVADDNPGELAYIESLIASALSQPGWKFDAVHGEYYNFGDRLYNASTPTEMQQYFRTGHHVLATIKPHNGSGLPVWNSFAGGSDDTYFPNFISDIQSIVLSPTENPSGRIMAISFNHEMYGNKNTDESTQAAGAAYIAAQQHLVDYLVQHLSAAAWEFFRIMWWPTAASYNTNVSDAAILAADAFYPGDGYVDWIGGDGYSRFPSNNNTPTAHGGVYLDFDRNVEDPKYTRGIGQSTFYACHNWNRTHTSASNGPYRRKTGKALPEQPAAVTCKPVAHGEFGIQSLVVPPPIWPGQTQDTTVTGDAGTSIAVQNAGALPASGQVAILQGGFLEVVSYTGKSANNLTGLTRGAWGTPQHPFSSGAGVYVPTALFGRAKLRTAMGTTPLTGGTIPCDLLQLSGGTMFPNKGPFRVKVDSEIINVGPGGVTSISANDLIACDRGVDGTAIVPHSAGAVVELVEDKGDGSGTKGMAAQYLANVGIACVDHVPELIFVSYFGSNRGAGPDNQQWNPAGRLSIHEGPALGNLPGGGEWTPDTDRIRALAFLDQFLRTGGGPPPPPPPPPPSGAPVALPVWKKLMMMTGTQGTVIIPPPPPPPPPPGTTALSEIPEASADHYASFWTDTSARLQAGRAGGCFGGAVLCGGKFWIGGYFDTIVAKDRTTTYVRDGLYWIDRTTLDVDPSFNAQLTPTGWQGKDLLPVWDLATDESSRGKGDGTKVVIVGNFSTVLGQARSHIAVFNSDGTLTSLFAGWSFNAQVQAACIVGTSLYLAGDFTSITPSGGVASARTRLCKINNWATAPALDTAWQPTISADMETYQLHHIVDSGNGRILISIDSPATIAGVACDMVAVGLTQADIPYWYANVAAGFSSVTPDDRVQKVVVGATGGQSAPGDSNLLFSYGGSAGLITYDHYYATDGDCQMTGSYKLSGETDPFFFCGGHGTVAALGPDINNVSAGNNIPDLGLLALESADFALRSDWRPYFKKNDATVVNGGDVLKTWGSASFEEIGLCLVMGDFTRVDTHDGSVVTKPKRRIAFFKEVSG